MRRNGWREGKGITITVLGGRRAQKSADDGGGESTGNIDGGDIIVVQTRKKR